MTARFAAARESGEALRSELRLRGDDGEYRWFLLQASPVRDDDGKVVQWFGAATDVHEQRVASDVLQQREEQLRLIIESQPDFAMFMVGANGHITAWNRAAEHLLGWTAAEALGRECEMIFTPEDRVARHAEGEILAAERRGKAPSERWYVTKNGRRFWGSGVLSAVRNASGETHGYLKILRDETERKNAEDAVHEARDIAERANITKDQFLATLSHELRTPLSVISLYAKMLSDEIVLDPEHVKTAVAAIGRGAEAQRALIDDLLDVSRITSGKLELKPREVRFTDLLRETVEAVAPTAALKGVRLATDLQEIGLVWCHPERLRQVVWNLTANAIKFTPSKGNVSVELRRSAHNIEIRIRDSGRGIEAEFLPHVFERFRQAELTSSRTTGGLGLGLAIVKSLVELHGGSVTLDSPGRDQGTTATVFLPMLIGEETTVNEGHDTKQPEAEDTLIGRKVLLVEDEQDQRRALVALLRRAHMRVAFAPTAQEAMNAIEKARPDIIVSDVGLPGEDGFSFMRRVRERETVRGLGQTPAIALTAFVRDDDRDRAMDAGFQTHLGKPFEPQRLLAAMRNLLDGPPRLPHRPHAAS